MRDGIDDDCSDVGFNGGVDGRGLGVVVDVADGESSPRYLGPLKILVGTTGESKVGHWFASFKVEFVSTISSDDIPDA